MTNKEERGEEILKDPEVIKLIMDYSNFQLMKMVVFKILDIQEIKFVEPMIQLGYTFILTCQTYAKLFKFQTPCFQFTYNDIKDGIILSVLYDEDNIDEESLKKYISETFSPEAKKVIEEMFKKDVAENPRMN